MIHPKTQLKEVSPEIGLGVFASQDIPCGTIVYVKDPLEIIIDEKQFQQLPQTLKEKADIYSYIESSGSRVLSWDSAKFVNHNCNANTLSTGYGFEIAVRDIAAGEEVTDDYGMFNVPHDMPLYCKCENCRGVLRAHDFLKLVPFWDKKVKNALSYLNKVEQPLIDLVQKETMASLMSYIESGQDYLSVEELYMRASVNVLSPAQNSDEPAKAKIIKGNKLKRVASSR